jgi:hypothetical protein
MEPWSGAYAQTFVGLVAGRIGDPVLRLRFLRAAARMGQRKQAIKRAAIFGAPVLLLAACVPLLRLTTQAAPSPVEMAKPAAFAAPVKIAAPAAPPQPAEVWRVEVNGEIESYSNGLRIDRQYAVSNHPRSYVAFPASGNAAAVRRSEPAGIVFHTTESLQAPFEASQNGKLKQIGGSLLDYVRRRKSYNYLIDRFGRVFRIVEETDAANHAGYSVWSDAATRYVNLNESFLGVSFEASTDPGQVEPTISPAQLRAAGMLIEMLRNRYHIAETNCVTHAQVSVNPNNMRVGYHTDWASSFPFEQLGLPDNYARPLPALSDFGFEYDPAFLRWTGTRMYAGVEAAEALLRQRAAEAGQTPAQMRKGLRSLYRERLNEMRRPAQETEESE